MYFYITRGVVGAFSLKRVHPSRFGTVPTCSFISRNIKMCFVAFFEYECCFHPCTYCNLGFFLKDHFVELKSFQLSSSTSSFGTLELVYSVPKIIQLLAHCSLDRHPLMFFIVSIHFWCITLWPRRWLVTYTNFV